MATARADGDLKIVAIDDVDGCFLDGEDPVRLSDSNTSRDGVAAIAVPAPLGEEETRVATDSLSRRVEFAPGISHVTVDEHKAQAGFAVAARKESFDPFDVAVLVLKTPNGPLHKRQRGLRHQFDSAKH
jgi:hypothetical protein